jgi:flavodoxin/Pyruvate/2-oxoacid:ferredoxin oxidoreductase delta subunit
MGVGIYYFSGTGNSLYVAKDIARKTGGMLYPIASLVYQSEIEISLDRIGIVFPTYYGELPVIIKNFASKLKGIENKYIFAVSTFGGSAGHSLKLLKRIIQENGGELSATYRVHMPQNSFSKPWENNTKLYTTWNKQSQLVADNINKGVKGEFLKHFWLAPYFLLVDSTVGLMKPYYRRSFIKLSSSPSDLSTDELIHRNDVSYWVNENCNSCEICLKVCPVSNIELTNGRPFWLHHCENCLACYHWCPQKAIKGGVVAKGYYYRHPEIKVNEIMAQKNL